LVGQLIDPTFIFILIDKEPVDFAGYEAGRLLVIEEHGNNVFAFEGSGFSKNRLFTFIMNALPKNELPVGRKLPAREGPSRFIDIVLRVIPPPERK
jgi:hypothetical protein